MVPLSDAVAITHIRRQIVDDAFTPSEPQQAPAAGMLGELLRWTEALQGLRDGGTPARSG